MRDSIEDFSDPSGGPLADGPLGRLWRGLVAVDRFIRIHFLGFTFLLALLGVATVVGDPSPAQILAILGGALCFHNFAYVFNDVVDLPVDRTDPARQDDYLVSGVVRPWQALAFSLAQIPIAVALTLALGGGAAAVGVLLFGFTAMAVYDVWGKRCFFPPLTDFAQGLGWASLAPWAALTLGGAPNVLTWVVAAYGAGFILLINGVHGGLRDLANDLERGATTTASFFGSRPTPRGATMPASLAAFAILVQAGLVAVSIAPLLRRDFGYAPEVWTTTTAAVVLMNLACLVFLWLTLHPRSDGWQRAFRLHLFLLNLVLLVLFVPAIQSPLRWIVVIGYLAPALFFDLSVEWIGRAWRRLVSSPVRATE